MYIKGPRNIRAKVKRVKLLNNNRWELETATAACFEMTLTVM